MYIFLDIDLEDPDVNDAAVKIQAAFRGHQVRKEKYVCSTRTASNIERPHLECIFDD